MAAMPADRIGYTTRGQGFGYAFLKSTKPGSNQTTEIWANFDAIHGFGDAKTEDGRLGEVTL